MPETKVRCPRCSRPQIATPAKLYWCPVCRAYFDDDPDEGGTHYNDPSKRMEKAEDRRENRRRRR